MNKVYTYVTERIIKKMEETGLPPWRMPWIGKQVNYVSQVPYRGANTLLLSKPGEYLTFKQIQEKKGILKEGSKAEMVIFFKPVQKESSTSEKDNDKKDSYVVLRYYNVFHLDDVEGLPSKILNPERNATIEEAQKIWDNYPNPPKLIHSDPKGGAYYRPATDVINVPRLANFANSEQYYASLFHEGIHSTGHHGRLKRPTTETRNKFGDEQYSKEELIAEIGASMLMGVVGLKTFEKVLTPSAAYIKGWASKLSDDPTLIVSAAAQAQKAADYIQGKL